MATRTEFLIHDLKFQRLSDQLPDNVFLMSVKVTLARSNKRDTHMTTATGDPIREKSWPVSFKESEPSPYIPPTRVHLTNPAENPDKGEKAWRFETFVNRMTAGMEALSKQYPGEQERVYLNDVKLVEVPPEYVYREDEDGNKLPADSKAEGYRNIRRSLYDDRAELAIGHFRKRPSITDDHVRDQLGTVVAGEVLQPLRLTDVKLVHAKCHQNAETRRKYFTDGQASQYGDANLAPREIDADSEAYVQKTLHEQFPELAQSDFLDVVRFSGHFSNNERFVPEDAQVLQRVRADGGGS